MASCVYYFTMVSISNSPMASATAAIGAATLFLLIALKKKKERCIRRGNFPSSSPWFLPSFDLLFVIRAGSLDKFVADRVKVSLLSNFTAYHWMS